MSSLIGQLPLAAVWFYCKDVNHSKRFYKDIVGLKPLEDGVETGSHFDLGTVRLTLLPAIEDGKKGKNPAERPSSQQYLVFHVESSIESVYRDLVKRGVKMRSKSVVEDAMGKTAWFNDPDGHVIFLWQPPKKESKNFKQVESLVKHYESVSRALADLRLFDEEAKQDN